jgi:hypothetical protein
MTDAAADQPANRCPKLMHEPMKEAPNRSWRSSDAIKAAMVAEAFLALSGCGVVPSVNILGSFFPAWLISIVIGVVLTVLTRQVFLMTKIAPYLRHAALMYPCLILLWTLATWLVVFAS